MPFQPKINISNFIVAGINYKKTDAALRSRFAIGSDQYQQLLLSAAHFGVNELFVISTCNRTEIYGFAENENLLVDLLCSQTQGTVATFQEIAYIKKGTAAIAHLFEVAAGLDSQILGDYEILGQLKQAIKFSKKYQCVGPYLDRLVNAVLQASKLIKTNTALSGGTVSVAFAAIQYIKDHVNNIPDKKIVLIGTGKIGRNTSKNLVDYLHTKNITLVNRTDIKATALANELGISFAAMANLSNEVNTADIILVASNAALPVIYASQLQGAGKKIIIDLSIPCNVEKSAELLPEITLINVDALSKIKDATLSKREAEIPKAKQIIQEQLNEFLAWHEMRKYVPVLKKVKQQLNNMHQCKMYISYAARLQESVFNETEKDIKIQKVINGMAVKMRSQNQCGCNYIEAINEFIATGTN